MDRSDAVRAVAVLRAAFPTQVIPEDTIDLYASQLERLKNREVLKVAIQRILDNATFWPSLGEIREAYMSEARHRALSQPALDEPDLTPEQIAENVRRRDELVERISVGMDWP